MLKIAVVDDSDAERRQIQEHLNELSSGLQLSFSISEFSTGFSFLDQYQPEYDLVFLDVEMPGMNGMDTAHALRKLDSVVTLIFVTNLAQYAIEGYEVGAADYILKPINRYSFAMKVQRAIARTTKQRDETISIKAEGGIYQVRITDVFYLEVSGHYVLYHTQQGVLAEYTTLKDAEQKISRTYFVRCSRSFLVNLRHVSAINKESILVEGDTLFIARPQKKAFLAAFSEYMGGSRS